MSPRVCCFGPVDFPFCFSALSKYKNFLSVGCLATALSVFHVFVFSMPDPIVRILSCCKEKPAPPHFCHRTSQN